MSLFKFLLGFLLVAHSVASPSVLRRHHDVAARMAFSASPLDLPAVLPVKRASNKRCRPRPSSTSTSTTARPSTTAPAVVGNVGSSPETDSTSTTTSTHSSITHTHTTSSKTSENPKPSPTDTGAGSGGGNDGGNNGNLPSYLVGTQTGEATYYDTGLTACGSVNNDGQKIAAVSHLLFDSFPGAGPNPNLNPVCGRKVRATYKGNSVEVEIRDRCTACALTDLDFTPTAMQELDPNYLQDGRLFGMTWVWI